MLLPSHRFAHNAAYGSNLSKGKLWSYCFPVKLRKNERNRMRNAVARRVIQFLWEKKGIA